MNIVVGSALVMGCLVGAASVQGQEIMPPDSPQGAGLVDALNGVFGKQTYGRAIHAKGIVLEGSFAPEAGAESLSEAPHFKGPDTPVTVRFSNFAGIPNVSDTDGLATPRGMAIKFHLRDGAQADIVAHSFNGFPAATAEEFRQLMVAIGQSGPGTKPPTPADVFLTSHPIAKAFFDSLPSPPVSFATVTYFGVNSFKFTNAAGQAHFGRYQLLPLAGTHFLSKAEVAAASHDYLAAELQKRISRGPLKFLLQVQLSSQGDAIDNPSIAWGESNQTVTLGTLTIARIVADSDAAERALLFTPAAVTAGIEPADPMIQARDAAYAVSYARRHAVR